MIRRCLVLICALASCAPNTRETWFKSLGKRSDGLCWWRNARWEDRATLLVRGTGEPFAHARARWAGDMWRGSNITGVLRREGPLVVLQGEWSGPGLSLIADVDVSAQAVFRAYQPARVGAAGLLLKGGLMRVNDAISGRALVVPAEESARAFREDGPQVIELGCDALSLSATQEPAGGFERRQLAQSGFPMNAPERWVPDHLSLPASAERGGVTIGRFVAQDLPLRGFVVEQQNDEARLVVPTKEGVVWVGWVAAEGLQAPQGEVAAPAAALQKVGASFEQSATEWRACEKQELQVMIESHGSVVHVGTLEAGVAFSILSRRGEYREVRLGVEWLEVEPDVRLLVPSWAGDCPRQQHGTW